MKKMVRMLLLVGFSAAVAPGTAFAHCDALDGPVVKAARAALEAGSVTKVLAWVPPERETELRDAFNRTLQVRRLGAEAQALADTWFFETLVRIHRAGEGAPFDGLKPAGHIEPLVTAVDETLDTGAVDGLLAKVTSHVSSGVRERFVRAREARAQADDSVEAGRRFVAAYVDYQHYVEGLHKAALGTGATHGATADAAAGHQHPR
jgi:hypothetical protein